MPHVFTSISPFKQLSLRQFVNPDDDWKPVTCQHINVRYIDIGTFLLINQQY